MTTEPSFACTLSSSELPERAAQMRRLGDTLVGIQHSLTLRFGPDPDTLARVEAFVAAESRCCPFLDFELERHSAETVLTVRSPHGAEAVLAEMARHTEGRS